MTIAGNGQRSATAGTTVRRPTPALNNPSGVAAAPNGDIYIADTLNYRVRMIDHATGFIHTIAGDGNAGDDDVNVGDGGPAISAHLNMPSDVALAPNGDIYIADMHHQRVRKVDARTRIITTVAGNGRWGNTGDGGPATQATLAGPAGITVVPDGTGNLTLFIADYYNGRVRAVGPDGIIRDVTSGRARSLCRAHTCGLRAPRRLALRHRLEPRPPRRPEYREDCADARPPRRAAQPRRPPAPRRPSGMSGPRQTGRQDSAAPVDAVVHAALSRPRDRRRPADAAAGGAWRARTLAAEDRHRLRARPARPAGAAPRVDVRPHRWQRDGPAHPVRRGRRDPPAHAPDRVGRRRAAADRHGPAHGVRPALQAARTSAVARTAAPHHDQHGRRGLPRRRRRLLDREPGDERRLPAWRRRSSRSSSCSSSW